MTKYPTIEIHIDLPPEDCINRAKSECRKLGLHITGNRNKGDLNGNGIKGYYNFENGKIKVQLTEIGFPAFLIYSFQDIKKELIEYFK